MSTLEFPEIAEQPAAPVAVVEPKQATLKETALASFGPIVAHMATLAKRYKDVAFDLMTPKGLAEAKAARLVLREEGRYAVQRLQKRLKDEANDLKRTIDAKADEAIAIIKPVEDDIHARIEAREQAIEAEREKARQAEAARRAVHEAGIADIRSFLGHAQQPGMTAARIAAGMDILRGMEFGPTWEEFAVPAANAQCETLDAMRLLHEAAVAREAEAARLEAQRLENERIAAENARVAADLKRQADELAAQQAAVAAREQAERDRIAAEQAESDISDAVSAAFDRAWDRCGSGYASAIRDAWIAARPTADGKGIARDAWPEYIEALDALQPPARKTPEDYDDIPSDPPAETNTTSEAAPQQASAPVNPEADAAPGGTEGIPEGFLPGLAIARARDAGLITEAEMFVGYEVIREGKPYAGPVQIVTDPAGQPGAIADLIRLRNEARGSKFPSQPKVGPEWFAAFYAAVDAIESERA